MTDYVLTGLLKRRAKLTGTFERTYEALRGMPTNLESPVSTILQFDPTFRVEMIKATAFRPPPDRSDRDQMSQVVLSIVRQAAVPLTRPDIALELLVSRAMAKWDQKFLRLVTKRVEVALRTLRDSGTVRGDHGSRQFALCGLLGNTSSPNILFNNGGG